MFGYYVDLALRSLKRNVLLTGLMIAAIGVGIGASMTVFTVLHTLSGDPIPKKSSKLFVPLIDNWGPDANRDEMLRKRLSYLDAMALMQARAGVRQSAMYTTYFSVTPRVPNMMPFAANGRAVYADFFKMFEIPFRAGGPWSKADDEDRANVVVLASKVADKLFPNGNAVGQTVKLDQRDYRVVGVLGTWDPQPRFYDLISEPDDVFLPFSTAIDRQMQFTGFNSCYGEPATGWVGHLNSECIWVGFWVELPTPSAVRSYREFLHNYAAEQQRLGRFQWAPRVSLYNVREWLTREKVVPHEFRVATLVAFGFLLVCLLNCIGLMLAKFSSRVGELSVRRALGASKGAIFGQCLTETAVVGAVGGLLGLGLTVLGLKVERGIMGDALGRLTHLDPSILTLTLCLAVISTMCAGIYPSWRASHVHPAWQLKAQ